MNGEGAMTGISSAGVFSAEDRVRAGSTEVDAGLTRARFDVSRLRGEIHGARQTDVALRGDITDIRGDISDVGGIVSAFRGAVTDLRYAIRASGHAAGGGVVDPTQIQAQAVADAAMRQAIGADASVSTVSSDLTGLAREVPKL